MDVLQTIFVPVKLLNKLFMARIDYLFPIKTVHGWLEKGGIVFKALGKTYFTSRFGKRKVAFSAKEITQHQNFTLIRNHVLSLQQNPTRLEELRVEYSKQSKFDTFNKYLWYVSAKELGIITD